MFTGLLSITLAAIFTGAAFYINVAEQPARLKLDDRSMVAQWKSSYPRGFAMQASLAVASALSAFWTAWQSEDWRWGAGGLIMAANWPYTLLVMMATNRSIGTTPLEQAGPESRALIAKWGGLHAVRTLLGASALGLFVWASA